MAAKGLLLSRHVKRNWFTSGAASKRSVSNTVHFHFHRQSRAAPVPAGRCRHLGRDTLSVSLNRCECSSPLRRGKVIYSR
jgi:hypothetical protein